MSIDYIGLYMCSLDRRDDVNGHLFDEIEPSNHWISI